MSETSGIVGPIEDPWEKWVLKKAIEQQRVRLRKEGKLELLRHEEKLRSENEKKQDRRNQEVYSKWLFEKRRGSEMRADEERLEGAVRIETERKEKLKEAKSREKFREWTASKDEAERLAASVNKRAEEDKYEIKRASRLKAAEAYELWLIEHPFKLIPKPSFVNPRVWDDNTD